MRQRRRNRTRWISIMMMVVLLSGMSAVTVFAEEKPDTEPDIILEEEILDQRIGYVALGDSIPNGYSANEEVDIVSYPELIVQDLQNIAGAEVEFVDGTKSGLTTKKLNTVVLQREEIQESLKNAEIVTVTIGANDLMNEFKKVAREILNNDTHFLSIGQAMKALQKGIKDNPLLLVKVAGAISNWDYATFEDRWKITMENINALASEDRQMVVTTLYNPLAKMELPGTLNSIVEGLISKMNDIIRMHAEEYNYQVVDLLDSGIGEKIQPDGLHPNQDGQVLICNLVEEQFDTEEFESIREYREQQEKERLELEKQKELAREQAKQEKIRQEEERKQRNTVICCSVLCCAVALMELLRQKEERASRRIRG